MKIKIFKRKPLITVVVNFYNNRREAKRTLFSLTSTYQNVDQDLYNVVVIDNNSTEPLDKDFVRSFGSNFSYIYINNNLPSPCKAINYTIKKTNTKYVIICIDGARILSPGILIKMMEILNYNDNPFIYTIGMHIGDKAQNFSIEDGYNQETEDFILSKSDWKKNGYKLFDVSCFALSSSSGYFDKVAESNCFLLSKKKFIQLGGYDERFTSPGGGLCNLHFFNTINSDKSIFKCRLLGEATFHQFHNGIATNVAFQDHPWKKMEEEYFHILGKHYSLNEDKYFIY